MTGVRTGPWRGELCCTVIKTVSEHVSEALATCPVCPCAHWRGVGRKGGRESCWEGELEWQMQTA